MEDKINNEKKQSIMNESNKLIDILLTNRCVIEPFYFRDLPEIYYGIFIKIGFKEYPHQFSKYGKVSISLRKIIEGQNVHILLRTTESGKNWIKIHADKGTKDHKTRKLNHPTVEKLSDNIQNGILYAFNNVEWLEQQKKIYEEHKNINLIDPNKSKIAKRIKFMTNVEGKGWLTTREKRRLEKRRERIKKKFK